MVDDSPVFPISTMIDANQPATKCFVPVIDKWQKLKLETGGLPSSRAFQPDHLRDFPSRVSIIEPVDNGEDFKFVIYAAAIVDASGVDMTGYRISDFHDEKLRTSIARNVRDALRNLQPGIWRYRHSWKERSYDYCSLYLPLRHGDDDRVRFHSIMVNTDPARRQLYTGQFERTRKAVKPDEFSNAVKRCD